MKRTQIQIPDHLFRLAKELADKKEISLAELVRRGLEYMLAVTPGSPRADKPYELPKPQPLHSKDPFGNPNWREQLHTGHLRVAEGPDSSGSGKVK